MDNTGFTITNHFSLPEQVMPDNSFEKKYVELRTQEKRLYHDEELLHLPTIPPEHPHYREWRLRKQSSRRLVNYLTENQKPLQILEAACGNGWLAHRLASIAGSKVIGSDINFTELQQAARVFRDIPNLHFIYAYIRSGIFGDGHFDVIVFAASIQYFPSFSGIVNHARNLLNPAGEIHILDSPFYSPGEAGAAKKRTENYYKNLGFPEMAGHYHHHTLNDLEEFNYEILYKPTAFTSHFIKNKNPFYWFRIKKENEHS